MFVGHFAVALAAKAAQPKTSLGTNVAAAQFCDLLWPVLVLSGAETVTVMPGDTVVTPLRFDSYPWSHSLAMVAVWAALFGAFHFMRERRPGAAFVLAGLVLSHWLLDYFSHRADMPLAPGNPTLVGLGLWNSRDATIFVETAMLTAGLLLYLRAAPGVSPRRLWTFIGVLLAINAANMLGPPPPNETAVAVSALLLIPVVWWTAWLDRPITSAPKSARA